MRESAVSRCHPRLSSDGKVFPHPTSLRSATFPRGKAFAVRLGRRFCLRQRKPLRRTFCAPPPLSGAIYRGKRFIGLKSICENRTFVFVKHRFRFIPFLPPLQGEVSSVSETEGSKRRREMHPATASGPCGSEALLRLWSYLFAADWITPSICAFTCSGVSSKPYLIH